MSEHNIARLWIDHLRLWIDLLFFAVYFQLNNYYFMKRTEAIADNRTDNNINIDGIQYLDSHFVYLSLEFETKTNTIQYHSIWVIYLLFKIWVFRYESVQI